MAMMGLSELIIIGVILLVLLVGVVGAGVLVFVLVSRSKAKGPPAGVPSPSPYQPAQAPQPQPQPQPPPQPAAAPAGPVVRMLAAADYGFSKIDTSMRQCDLVLQGSPGSGEPASAVWSDGKHRVSYQYDARYGLRMLEISGPNAKYLRNDILNIAYMPTLEGYKVSGLLSSSNPTEALQGILAAEFIGINGDQKYYINPVATLMQHPDARVSQEAQRVHAVLTART